MVKHAYRVIVVTRLPDNQDIRYANFLLLLEECGKERGAAAELSRRTKIPQPYISQLRRRTPHSARGAVRTIGDDTARALERGMDKPRGWMDHDHSTTVDDRAFRLAARIARLTPEQRQALEQTADAFMAANGQPPPEDGPEIRQPKPRRH